MQRPNDRHDLPGHIGGVDVGWGLAVLLLPLALLPPIFWLIFAEFWGDRRRRYMGWREWAFIVVYGLVSHGLTAWGVIALLRAAVRS